MATNGKLVYKDVRWRKEMPFHRCCESSGWLKGRGEPPPLLNHRWYCLIIVIGIMLSHRLNAIPGLKSYHWWHWCLTPLSCSRHQYKGLPARSHLSNLKGHSTGYLTWETYLHWPPHAIAMRMHERNVNYADFHMSETMNPPWWS